MNHPTTVPPPVSRLPREGVRHWRTATLGVWAPAFAGVTAWLIVSAWIFPLSLAADPTPPADHQGISLNFQNTDIDLVLKFISDVTGRVFIKSDAVRGFVSVTAPGHVTTTEALDVLQKVLEVKGFTMVPGGGNMIKVLSQAEAVQGELDVGYGSTAVQGDRMITQVVPLKFLSASEVKAELAPLVSKSGNLAADERMNALVITDMASNIRRLLKMIASLDVRTAQVLIEATIMEVSLTDETKLGVEWSNNHSFHGSDRQFDASVSQTFDLGSVVTEGLKYAIIRSDQNLALTLRALATNKDVNILSTPHILTVNNQPAVIRVGEEVPILTQTRNIQGGETIRSYDYKSVAIELEVTPRVNEDRDVFMKVHPLVKKILGFNAELNAPILATREAQTSVIVKDGQTVVIGGLMKDDRAISESKVPILGDIPLLGAFFKTKSVTKEKTELLVFLTPRVVLNSQEAHAVTIEKEAEAKTSETPHRLSAAEHFRLGEFNYREKRFADAVAEWQKVIEDSPDERLRKKARKRIEKVRKR